MTEILIAKKEKGDHRMKFRVTEHRTKGWAPNRYEKIIASKDFNQVAMLLFDLNAMGYPVDKAYTAFKKMLEEPELFFLK